MKTKRKEILRGIHDSFKIMPTPRRNRIIKARTTTVCETST